MSTHRSKSPAPGGEDAKIEEEVTNEEIMLDDSPNQSAKRGNEAEQIDNVTPLSNNTPRG